MSWTLPFVEPIFASDDYLHNGVMWYQNNIPCPKILNQNHVYRVYTAKRRKDKLDVDIFVTSAPAA